MSVSKGNELLQELYARLTGVWYNTGKYSEIVFPQKEVKQLIKEINKEYENDTDIKGND